MGNPNPLNQFKPGHAPIGGRPKAWLTKSDVQLLMGRFAKMKKRELRKIAEDEDSGMLEATVAAIFIRASGEGDYNRLNFLLDRTIGKVREEIRIDTSESDLEARARLIRDIMGDPETLAAAEKVASKVAEAKLLPEVIEAEVIEAK